MGKLCACWQSKINATARHLNADLERSFKCMKSRTYLHRTIHMYQTAQHCQLPTANTHMPNQITRCPNQIFNAAVKVIYADL